MLAKLGAFALLALIAGPALAAMSVSVDALLQMVVYIVIIALIFWLIWWFIGYVGIPEPFNKVIRVIVGLVALLILISFLLGLTGHPFVTLH